MYVRFSGNQPNEENFTVVDKIKLTIESLLKVISVDRREENPNIEIESESDQDY